MKNLLIVFALLVSGAASAQYSNVDAFLKAKKAAKEQKVEADHVLVAKRDAIIREESKVLSEEVARITEGEVVSVLEDGPKYIKVEFKGQIGYVHKHTFGLKAANYNDNSTYWIGMTVQQAKARLGRPTSISTYSGGTSMLYYENKDLFLHFSGGVLEAYSQN